MTRREIVIAALQHKETPIVPFHAEFTMQEYENMVRYTGDENFHKKYGGFLHYMQYWGYPTERKDKKEYFTDDFGVTWNRSGADKDIGVVDEPIIPEAAMELCRHGKRVDLYADGETIRSRFIGQNLRFQPENHRYFQRISL